MKKEVSRNRWSRFCKQFSATNQFRRMTISVEGRKGRATISSEQRPFLGVMIQKKDRKIDRIQFFAGRGAAEAVSEPVFEIQQPSRFVIERDQDGQDMRLMVESADGARAELELAGSGREEGYQSLVKDVAYSIFQQRGNHGRDLDNWLTAEKIIQDTSTVFTR